MKEKLNDVLDDLVDACSTLITKNYVQSHAFIHSARAKLEKLITEEQQK